MRLRSSIVFLAALACASALAVPAGAIIGGQPDNGAHPQVGLVLDPITHEICSGVLLSPTILVTAAHCFPAGNGPALVSFAEHPRSQGGFIPGTAVLDPSFCLGCGTGLPNADTHDVAVVHLVAPVTGVSYGVLPPLGLADQFKGKTADTAVGYGVRGFTQGGGPKQPDPSQAFDRYQGVTTFSSSNGVLSDEFMKVSSSKVALCFGDSGGPNFVDGTLTVLALTSISNHVCASNAYAYRLDTQQAQSFIRSTAQSFGVTLP